MILKLTKYTDPIWKSKFKNISQITPEIKKLVKDMWETLEITNGVGLAAPQVGSPTKLFIISYGKLKEVFINPKIIRYGKEIDNVEEGCLSVPCTRGDVARPTEVEIEYIDLKGRRKIATLRGYYARIAQHEYDHLSSIFYVDRILDKKKIYKYEKFKIAFFGTPEFGAIILRTLIGQSLVGDYEIPLVITAPDRPAGRGNKISPSPVKELALKFGLNVITPEKLKGNNQLVEKLKSLNLDFIVVSSYGKILPKELLKLPKYGAINVHPSLLPNYRGPSPIQTALLDGKNQTGISIFLMNEKMDEGDILSSLKVKIKENDTYKTLSQRLAKLSGGLLIHTLNLFAAGKIKPKPQEDETATYTKIITKNDGYIDWQNPPKNLKNMIKAYYPWPGVWTKYKDKILKILPGGIVQLEGKQPIKLEEFKQGHPDFDLNSQF